MFEELNSIELVIKPVSTYILHKLFLYDLILLYLLQNMTSELGRRYSKIKL